MKKVAIIMAGGKGELFWPRSTENHPKQFNYMMGEGTMVQNTFTRLTRRFEKEDIYVVTNHFLREHVVEQLPELPSKNIISEPLARNTAPCVALTTTLIKDKYPEDTIISVFPADHIISNVREFNNSMETAWDFAYEREAIVTIGISPDRPEQQFGYVQIEEEIGELDEFYERGVRKSTAFAEKPDIGTAQRFIESGDFLWNSGIFVSRMDVFFITLRKLLPDIYDKFDILAQNLDVEDFEEKLTFIYKQINPISLDYGILEKSDNVYVVVSSFTWSDLETWDELYRLSMKDARNNVIEGDVISIDSKNSFISGNGKMIAVVGIDDVIVVDTDEAILVCKKGESQKVQEVVNVMKRKHIKKF